MKIGSRARAAQQRKQRLALLSEDAQPLKRYDFQGLPIVVENPTGTVRRWMDGKGNSGATTMRYDYGYIDGHIGADGDEVDCYIGPYADSKNVYIVHQMKAPDFKKFDEDKVMIGFDSAEHARHAFRMHRNDDVRAMGGMSAVPLEAFKRKLQRRTGTGKIRCTDGVRPGVAMLTGKSVGGREVTYSMDRVGKWVPKLEAAARTRARQVMAPDLAHVKQVIDKAIDAHDLRRRLADAFAQMDPAALARVTGRALIMAELAGRHDLLHDT